MIRGRSAAAAAAAHGPRDRNDYTALQINICVERLFDSQNIITFSSSLFGKSHKIYSTDIA